MISRRVLPSARRRAAYSMVRSSMRMRIMAMRHRALLAWRLPPRLRRWRTVAPEDASTGLVPHSAAKDASLRIRSGLSPAATSSAAAASGPTPQAPSSAGLACSHSASRSGVESVDLSCERPVAACQRPQRCLGRRVDSVGGGVGAQSGARVDDGGGAKSAQSVFEVLGGGDDEAVDLVGGLGACLDRRSAGHRQHPDRLDGPVACFGLGVGVAVQRGACCGGGVDSVGLAPTAAGLAVGAVDLQHPCPASGETARQARPVGAGPLDADGLDGPVGLHPGEQMVIALRVGGERGRSQRPSQAVHDGGHMGVLVRVDPADDGGLILWHSCSCPCWSVR